MQQKGEQQNLKRVRKRTMRKTQDPKVFSLFDPVSNQRRDFPLYKDSEIGLSKKMFADHIFQTNNDDDQQTTMTVYKNAQEDVIDELDKATTKVLKRGVNKVVHNVNIEKRVMSRKNCRGDDSSSATNE